jgi:tetratricopeptide (TPR) repeat protein
MGRIDWTRFGLPSTVEAGTDDFPRPGEVTRYYRAQKRRRDASWTQKRLARELGLTERAVYYLESRDVGLDATSLRRRLARLLDIPPFFFGLASLKDENELGQTVRQYREMKSKDHPLRSQQGLARALGVTEKAIRDMEKKDSGLNSLTRRRLLVSLLDIPPAVLGILTFEQVVRQQQEESLAATTMGSQAKRETGCDLASYRQRLKGFWDRNHAASAQDRLTQITNDIAQLAAALAYTGGSDEKELRGVLCRYHQLYAHLLRDQGRYEVALVELEKAAMLAERADDTPLLVVTLLRIGSVLRDRGDVLFAQAKIEAALGNSKEAEQRNRQAHADYTAALARYKKIRLLEQVAPELQGVLLFDEGYARAHLAYEDRSSVVSALALIRSGGKAIEQARNTLEEEFSIRVTERTYRNTMIAALLAVGWPREALQELSDLMDLAPEGDMTRQNAYSDYLWGQAYADRGLVDAAVTPAQDALHVMKRIKSQIHVMRIAGLQSQLSQRDGKNIEVIRLGVMINS